jgi:two-component system NtrC family sensor kinase
MKRTALVSILAAAALALLVAFAMQSRSIPVDMHIAQHTVRTEVDRIREDFTTLVASLESSWRDIQSPGDATASLSERLRTSPDNLRAAIDQITGSTSEVARINNSFDGFGNSLSISESLTMELLTEQAAYADSVSYLRDTGPQIIQQMRDISLDRVAADTFQLIVGTVDFAAPNSQVQEFQLRRLLTMLNRDQRLDANMPTDVDRLLSAVATVLNTKSDIRSKLTQLRTTAVIESAENLARAVNDVYVSAVSEADGARTMLTLYAIVLLAAVAFIAYRLQASYGEINAANEELAVLNASLEHRVEERTEELSSAISDLKESQVQLVQAEKMSSLGQLVAGISHEINTPLLYLANNATLLQERVELLSDYIKKCVLAFSLNKSDFEDRNEYQTKFVDALRDVKVSLKEDEIEASLEETVDLIADSIEGLADLTEMAQSLKDFSRLDRAPVGSFDVNAGLDKTLTIARNIVKHKAEVHKFYGEMPLIECSPSKINQVFLNLITNAAQAIEGQGEIVIKTRLRDDDKVAISISDTGCGIPEENLGRIRDPFFTTKEVGTGTGLGLSIVDEIIRSHGGELLIESKVGHGSTFTVVLPVKQRDDGTRNDELLLDDASLEGFESDEAELAEAV